MNNSEQLKGRQKFHLSVGTSSRKIFKWDVLFQLFDNNPLSKSLSTILKILQESNRNLSYFGTNPPRFIAQRRIFGPNSPLLQIRFDTWRVQE